MSMNPSAAKTHNLRYSNVLEMGRQVLGRTSHDHTVASILRVCSDQLERGKVMVAQKVGVSRMGGKSGNLRPEVMLQMIFHGLSTCWRTDLWLQIRTLWAKCRASPFPLIGDLCSACRGELAANMAPSKFFCDDSYHG